MTRMIDADAFKKENERLLHCDFPYLSETTLEELIDEAPTIDAEPHWIPCSERLPEALEEVLVTSKYGHVYTSRIVHGEFEYGGEVIAWMPLPEPYEVEDDTVN